MLCRWNCDKYVLPLCFDELTAAPPGAALLFPPYPLSLDTAAACGYTEIKGVPSYVVENTSRLFLPDIEPRAGYCGPCNFYNLAANQAMAYCGLTQQSACFG